FFLLRNWWLFPEQVYSFGVTNDTNFTQKQDNHPFSHLRSRSVTCSVTLIRRYMSDLWRM
ncbi:MAG: hypothetical protein LBF62_08405, partial [Tannerellaceae bacterium]|nr:hypothetical protein [Tannerellaceae bacterium]